MNSGKYDPGALKARGFLSQRQPDKFSMRLHLKAGKLDVSQLKALSEAADKYGAGHVHVTTRQSIEIPFIDIEDVDRISEELEKSGLLGGASGQKVRGVVACQGDTVCNHGLINSPRLAERIDELCFGTFAPKKFKVAISGCPASCAKPQENDFGIMGVVRPGLKKESCVGCGLCEKVCKADAIRLMDGEVTINYNSCILCGECMRACKKEAIEACESGYAIFVGGKVGRFPRKADRLVEMVDEDVLFSILEKTLDYYREYGRPGERFGTLLDRLGMEKYCEAVL